jgi:hypothetical protein
VNDQPPYQNTPSGTPPPPPPPGQGYTYYPDSNAQVPPVAPTQLPSGAPQGYPQPGYPQSGYQQQGYQQPSYQQPNIGYPGYPDPNMGYQQLDRRRGMALAGFILGIISLFFWILFNGVGAVLNILLFILGIIFSSLGLRSRTRRGLAIAGLVLSIIGGLVTIIIFIIGIAIISTHSGY